MPRLYLMAIKAARCLLISSLVILSLNGCSKDRRGNPPPVQEPVGSVLVSIAPMTQAVFYAGHAISFAAVGKSSVNFPLTYQWDFGDGHTGSGAALSHTYANSGIYSVGVTATDSNGVKASSTSRLTVVDAVSVSIAPMTQAVFYTGRAISFAAVGKSSVNFPLTYQWDFGDDRTGSGAALSHTYARSGVYSVKVTATDSAGVNASSTSRLTVVDSVLTKPTITANPTSGFTGVETSFTGASSDSSGGLLTYSWDFGDNSGAVAGVSVEHSYAARGTYWVALTVTNDLGRKVSASLSYTVVAYNGVPTALVISAPTMGGTGKPVTLSASAVDAFPLTYSWDFGDGVAGSGASVQHAYANPGNYSITVTATNSKGGKAVSAPAAISVLQQVSNALLPACGGANCATISGSLYAGSGVGVWQYQNTSTTPVLLDFSIAGVKAEQVATLVFTNPTELSTLTAPGFGTSAATANQRKANSLSRLALSPLEKFDAQHYQMLLRNQELIRQLREQPLAIPPAGVRAENLPPVRPVAVGDTRVWIDAYDSNNPVSYTLKAAQSCTLKTGRKAVIWGDPKGGASASDLAELADAFCANGGLGKAGFDALTNMMGDAWGSHRYGGIIRDNNNLLQDIHIVVPRVPTGTGWGGYFWGMNNFLKSYGGYAKNSNEAMVFFVNGNMVKNSLDYAKSTLMHEAVHMINFYQRFIVRNVSHDTWLEETSAMMGEDILAKTIFSNGYNKIAQGRVPYYLFTGGGIGYVNWPRLSGGHYAMGGTFGAYLNRHYGISLFRNLVTNCKDGNGFSSYQCLNDLIKSVGGNGIGDDLARMGVSLFGNTPDSALPQGFGFPQRTVDGRFDAIDIASMTKYSIVEPEIPSSFMPTSHYFTQEKIAARNTTWVKNGIVVPSGAVLHIMLRDPAP